MVARPGRMPVASTCAVTSRATSARTRAATALPSMILAGIGLDPSAAGGGASAGEQVDPGLPGEVRVRGREGLGGVVLPPRVAQPVLAEERDLVGDPAVAVDRAVPDAELADPDRQPGLGGLLEVHEQVGLELGEVRVRVAGGAVP